MQFHSQYGFIYYHFCFHIYAPFQHNFLDLFEGLGLDISEPKAEDKSEDSPDFSYDIEVFALSLLHITVLNSRRFLL